jgi:hypothetical protein
MRAEFMHMFGEGDAPVKKDEVKKEKEVKKGEEPTKRGPMRIHKKESKKVGQLWRHVWVSGDGKRPYKPHRRWRNSLQPRHHKGGTVY